MKYLRSWLEIDQKVIADNINLLKSNLDKNAEMLLVVKGNAYGYSMIEASKVAIKQGVSFLGVAYLEEAETLRNAGIEKPILLLTQPQISEIPRVIELNLIPTVYSYEFARNLSKKLMSVKKNANIHIKVDTGFNRLGIKEENILEIQRISLLPYIKIQGFYTHFASASNDDLAFTRTQFALFSEKISLLKKRGIVAKYLHVANSPAFAWLPESHLNLVRLGMAAFGLQPSMSKDYPINIMSGITWKARILQIKTVNKGECVGYDNSWKATRKTLIACISVGYADGFRRGPKNFGFVLCGVAKCPITGNVSMSLATIKIKSSLRIKEGDEVVIVGKQGKENISFEDIARSTDTSNEEIITNISTSLPRIFL